METASKNREIRKATIKDAGAIDKLNKEFFHEEGRNWKVLISSKESEMFVLEVEKTVVGFTGVEYREWNNTVQIIDIFLHPDYRGEGYGMSLVKFLLEYLKKKKYRTLLAEAPSLNPVLGLYFKNGFRICGFNDRYYSNKGKEIALFLSFDFK